jgi:hypothetical protein
MIEVQEDEVCPCSGCDGIMQYPEVENCSCHLDPPCPAHERQCLVCTACGWEEGEAVEHPKSWRDRESLLNAPMPTPDPPEPNPADNGWIKFDSNRPMISASGEAEDRRYKVLTGKSGKRWLIAIQPNEGDNVYMEGDPGSDGFGGRTISFPLEDGTVLELKGPWKTTSGLYHDTGYDVSGKFLTMGVVALEHMSVWNPRSYWSVDWYRGIIHRDTDWVISSWDRIDRIAQAYADEHQCNVFRCTITYGGSSTSRLEPKK